MAGTQDPRMEAARPSVAQVREWLAAVADPEIPVLSVIDLGIIRDLRVLPDGVEVSVAPTYIGCPATEVIEQSIKAELERRGERNVSIRRVLSPPWTTDWLTDAGKAKLAEFGIAPPAGRAGKRALTGHDPVVACPRCRATCTRRISEFGSTPCKASYKCDACFEPFEYFKCL